jgi:hypothetical protein
VSIYENGLAVLYVLVLSHAEVHLAVHPPIHAPGCKQDVPFNKFVLKFKEDEDRDPDIPFHRIAYFKHRGVKIWWVGKEYRLPISHPHNVKCDCISGGFLRLYLRLQMKSK